jgi:hypothetical protein
MIENAAPEESMLFKLKYTETIRMLEAKLVKLSTQPKARKLLKQDWIFKSKIFKHSNAL